MSAWIWITILIAVAAGVAWALEKRRRPTHAVPPGLQPDRAFPHEQTFELYHNPFSLCSMKTRLCLAELGIDYASHPIDLVETGAYENIRPRLLAVNPAGTVPVLLHDGHPVYESHEQIRYAARFAAEGAPSLVPDEPELHRKMEDWVDRASLTDPVAEPDATAGNAIPAQTFPLFATMLERIPFWRLLEGLLFHFDRRRPLLFALLKIRGLRGLPAITPLAMMVARTRESLRLALDDLETQLDQSGGPWLLGQQYTLADVSWLVILERLRQVDAEHVFLDPKDRPRVAAWWARLRARPAYREAILERGNHPLVEYGRARIVELKAKDPEVRRLLEGA